MITHHITLPLLAATCMAVAQADVPVIPRPVSETTANGANLTDFDALPKTVPITSKTIIRADKALSNEKAILDKVLCINFASKSSPSNTATLRIDPTLPHEGYRLSITPEGLTIVGGDAAGVFYGIQTLKQMLIVSLSKGESKLPVITITDAPSCSWRGAMIDSARHFHPIDDLKKFIDAMATYKLNRLHWHLVDSEGWRLEIKKYPKLTEVCKDAPAEYPSEDPTDKSRPAKFMYGHFHGGGYYTQEQIRDIVAYAKARHIEIMPEIEFPAHAMVALTAYPEFGTTGQKPSVKSNISVDLFGPNEKALGFLKDILTETMALFPFEMIHFGGDEAPKGQWKNSPDAQAKIKELGLKDENALQAWMFNQLAQHIKKQGKRPVGWEEIMHGDNMATLTKEAVIMPWLSRANAVKSANAGYGIIHSEVGCFYLDTYQTSSPSENWTLYKGPLTLEKIYTFNLYPEGLTAEGKKQVFGAQCQLWSELMPKPEHVQYQAFPRLTALAELTWTPAERKDYQDYYKRLVKHPAVLNKLNINYRPINPLPIAQWSPETLNQPVIAIPVDAGTMKEAKGELIAQFDYKQGAQRLEISKVELLKNGKVVATDEHTGYAGSQHTDNFYRLKSSAITPSGNYTLRITHANGTGATDSRGDITLFTGTGTELFNPRNFAGGDYPSASWSKDEFQGKTLQVRIPMDGLVRTPGDYELIVKLNNPTATVTVGGDIAIRGTSGAGSVNKARTQLTSAQPQAMLPITIAKDDIRSGNSLILPVTTSAPVAGDVRVRKTTQLPAGNATGTYGWAPEILTASPTIAYVSNIQPTQAGKLTLGFDYKAGGNALNIHSVQVLCKGKVIAESTVKGFAGTHPQQNTYTLESPAIAPGTPCSLRLIISGADGTDSHGTLSVR